MGRGGLAREGGIRRRMCLGCRQVRAKRELSRLALGPAGVVLDERQALPGRGAYVCRAEACTTRVARQLAKALRSPGLHVSAAVLWQVVNGERVPVPEFEARPPDDGPVG